MKGWGIVGLAMFFGCLNLAGFPFTAGYFSKDIILGEAFANPAMIPIGWILLLTAGLTAYYTFRVFFRVFVGPKYFEPGDELHADHGHDDAHGHGHDDGQKDGHAATHGPDHTKDHAKDHFHPHPPGWAINLVLAILALATLFAFIPVKFGGVEGTYGGWVGKMVSASSAHYGGHAAYLSDSVGAHDDAAHAADTHGSGGHHGNHAKFFGFDAHVAMMWVSAIVGFIGIFIAFILHYAGRTTAAKSKADALLPAVGPLAKLAQGKWYVDELYNILIVTPLWVLSHVFHLIDKYIIDGLVDLLGWFPKAFGRVLRPSQSGELHGYALGMAGGLAVLLLIVVAAAFFASHS